MDSYVPFELLRPWWLLAVPAVGFVWFTRRRAHDVLEQYRGFAASHLLRHLLVAPRDGPRLRPDHLLILWLLVAAVAMAGPSWRKVPSPFAEDQSGLVVVLRVADSMTAADLSPSRLERARHKLQDLAVLRDGGAMGLIAYDGSAHLVVPLTRDSRIVAEMSQALEPGVMPIKGDALADAMDLAQSQLQTAGTPGSILVIADGVSTAQIEQLNSAADMPVQFLATVGSALLAEQGGVVAAAKVLEAELELVSIDDSDVRALSRRAEHIARSAHDEGEQRRDAGYLLIVPLLLIALWWGRRGWSVRWE